MVRASLHHLQTHVQDQKLVTLRVKVSISLALFLFDTNFNSTFQRLPIRLIKRLVIIHIFGAKIGLRRFESIERGGVPENHEK